MTILNRQAIAFHLQVQTRELARLEREPNVDEKELEIVRSAIRHYKELRMLLN